MKYGTPTAEEALKLALRAASTVRKAFVPSLREQPKFEQRYLKRVHQKSTDHYQYEFDILSHQLIIKTLASWGYSVQLFSEEGSWESGGTPANVVVICDPFDQSFLTTRSMRDASVGICVLSSAYEHLATVLADLSTGVTYAAISGGAFRYYRRGKVARLHRDPVAPSTIITLDEALVVMPGMSRARRDVFRTSTVTRDAKRVLNTDGIINFGRLGAGYIDAYLDPVVGKPAYEMIYASFAHTAGAVVADRNGVPFEVGAVVERFIKAPDKRFTFVAASTPSLSNEIQERLARER